MLQLSDEFWESFQNGKKDTAILDLIKKITKNLASLARFPN